MWAIEGWVRSCKIRVKPEQAAMDAVPDYLLELVTENTGVFAYKTTIEETLHAGDDGEPPLCGWLSEEFPLVRLLRKTATRTECIYLESGDLVAPAAPASALAYHSTTAGDPPEVCAHGGNVVVGIRIPDMSLGDGQLWIQVDVED